MNRVATLALLGALALAGCSHHGGASEPPCGLGPACPRGTSCIEGACRAPGPDTSGPMLSPTRLLRRTRLALLGSEPSLSDYQELLALGSDRERDARISALVDQALSSGAFKARMLELGHDWLRPIAYPFGLSNDGDQRVWIGGLSARVDACPAGSRYAGALGVLAAGIDKEGDPRAICDDPAAALATVEPWWAPGSSIQVIGRAGTGVRQSGGMDCAAVGANSTTYVNLPAAGCSCGPNLVYCAPAENDGYGDLDYNTGRAQSQRRMIFEEPAQLFTHLVMNDRPLTDLMMGTRTVVTRKLQHLYVRMARQNPANAALDDDAWWRDARDPAAWREVEVQKMYPQLLSTRELKHDPRAELREPPGVPAAGVMTSLGALASFARERVRGARFVEMFACYNFVPPPKDAQFNPFKRDPATEGSCQHCHRVLDPAAIHFKRFAFDDPQFVFGGVGPWRLDQIDPGSDVRRRWEATFEHDLSLTPVSQQDIDRNPDARLIDFLPPDKTLLGQTSDGTIGPLGFAKLVLASGEFDRCVVRRLHRRILGRDLDPGAEAPALAEMTEAFVSRGRAARPFIRYLVSRPDFKRGL